MCLAVQAAQNDDAATAERLAAKALSLADASHRTRVGSLVVLSRLAFYGADHARALEMSRQCAELTRPLADRWLLGNALVNLAESTEQAGEYDTAEDLLYEALGAMLELGAQGNVVAIIESIAGVYIADVYTAQHHVDWAIRLLGTTDAYRMDRGLPLSPAEQRRVESMITKARMEAGPIRFGLAWAAGNALTVTQTVTVTQAVNDVLRGRKQRSRSVHSQPRDSAPCYRKVSRTQRRGDWLLAEQPVRADDVSLCGPVLVLQS